MAYGAIALPEEVAIVRLPDTNGGVMIMARYAKTAWCGNQGNRAAVRVLLQEIDRLRDRVARLETACREVLNTGNYDEYGHIEQCVIDQIEAALEEPTP